MVFLRLVIKNLFRKLDSGLTPRALYVRFMVDTVTKRQI